MSTEDQKQNVSMDEEETSEIDMNKQDVNMVPGEGKKATASDANMELVNELTPELLDDIIERLVNHEKYPGYTISEVKQSAT